MKWNRPGTQTTSSYLVAFFPPCQDAHSNQRGGGKKRKRRMRRKRKEKKRGRYWGEEEEEAGAAVAAAAQTRTCSSQYNTYSNRGAAYKYLVSFTFDRIKTLGVSIIH